MHLRSTLRQVISDQDVTWEVFALRTGAGISFSSNRLLVNGEDCNARKILVRIGCSRLGIPSARWNFSTVKLFPKAVAALMRRSQDEPRAGAASIDAVHDGSRKGLRGLSSLLGASGSCSGAVVAMSAIVRLTGRGALVPEVCCGSNCEVTHLCGNVHLGPRTGR